VLFVAVSVNGFGATPDKIMDKGGCAGPDFHITFALEPDWAPWSSCPENPTSGRKALETWEGQCMGVVEPLYKAVCDAAGISCSHVVTEWSMVWEGDNSMMGRGLDEGHFDLAAAARNTFDRIDACMDFSNPYTVVGNGKLMSKTADDIPSRDADQQICGVANWAIGMPWINDYAKDKPHIRAYAAADNQMLVDLIRDGECHLGLFDGNDGVNAGLHLVEEIEGAAGGVSFAGNAKTEKTECALRMVNKGLSVLRKNGGLVQIWEDHDAESEGADAVELEADFENDDSRGCENDDSRGSEYDDSRGSEYDDGSPRL